mmetsp:Transcript_52615/g.138070  ORF Transcript_52615/g.138070 Transcript_52615/m.138070 type:complete len:209 (+) Transcript_52615:397-1023(+)
MPPRPANPLHTRTSVLLRMCTPKRSPCSRRMLMALLPRLASILGMTSSICLSMAARMRETFMFRVDLSTGTCSPRARPPSLPPSTLLSRAATPTAFTRPSMPRSSIPRRSRTWPELRLPTRPGSAPPAVRPWPSARPASASSPRRSRWRALRPWSSSRPSTPTARRRTRRCTRWWTRTTSCSTPPSSRRWRSPTALPSAMRWLIATAT